MKEGGPNSLNVQSFVKMLLYKTTVFVEQTGSMVLVEQKLTVLLPVIRLRLAVQESDKELTQSAAKKKATNNFNMGELKKMLDEYEGED